jgi:uncharacterized protein (DUF1330 family)
MSVFVIGKVQIRDRETYKQYQALTKGLIPSFGGKVLAADESPTVLEGSWPVTRTLLLQFDSEADALRWYGSEAYAAARPHRHRAATTDLVLLKGLETSA